MISKLMNAVIIGVGAAGLAVAGALSPRFRQVTIVETLPKSCQRQSGLRGGCARGHIGAYYWNNPLVARAVAAEFEHFSREAPELITPIESNYFVPASAEQQVIGGWEKSLVHYKDDPGANRYLRDDFRKKHEIRSLRVGDQAINAAKLPAFLSNRLGSNVATHFGATPVAADSSGNRVKSVVVRLMDGTFKRIQTDLVVVAAGAGTHDTLKAISPAANLGQHFSNIATAVARFDWSPAFPGAPRLLQLQGTHQLALHKNLAIIPIGPSNRASVALSGGTGVADHENVELDAEAAYAEMLHYMRDAFEMTGVPTQVEASFCVKAQLVSPQNASEGATAARLVTCLLATDFGGAENVILAAPGKLSGIFSLRDQVISTIEHLEGHRVAA